MKIALQFMGGIIMTLLYVLFVPYVTSTYITPFIVENVGEFTFLSISSEMIIQILMILVTLGFILLLGGGAVLRWCGVVGVIGMIVAYALLGDVRDATIPVISLIVVYIILTLLGRKKKKKDDNKKKDKASKS